MSVRDKIKEKFSAEELKLFDFAVSSFPESLLVHDQDENIVALLAILAKTFGNSRDLIFNLKKAHGIEALYKDIKLDSPLSESNKQLLLPLADDLGYHRIYGDLTKDELIDQLIEEEPFVESYYQLYKNRGTMVAIEQTIKKFAEYLGQTALNYDIYEFQSRVIILLQYLEEHIDLEAAQEEIALESCQWFSTRIYTAAADETANDLLACGQSETKTLCFYDDIAELWNCTEYIGLLNLSASKVRQDSIIYDMLMKFKPAGVRYDILLKYAVSSIINTLADRVIARSGTDNIMFPQVEASQTMVESETLEIVDVGYLAEASKNYNIIIKNNSNVIAYEASVTDWNDGTVFDLNSSFEAIKAIQGATFTLDKYIIGPKSERLIERTSTDPDYTLLSTYAAYFRNIGKSNYKSVTIKALASNAITALTMPIIWGSARRSANGTGYFIVDITNNNPIKVNVKFRQRWYAQTDTSESGVLKSRTITFDLSQGTYNSSRYFSSFSVTTKVRVDIEFTVGGLISNATYLIENIAPISEATSNIISSTGTEFLEFE